MPSLMKKICAASIAAMGMTAASAATITNLDGSFSPFGAFDWNSAGSSMTVGPIVDGGNITTFYMANAVSIQDTSGNNFPTPNLDTGPLVVGTYEYTVFATINETVDCVDAGCNAAAFTSTGGTWFVYYDTSPDANLVTGAGITDGDLLLSGTIDPGFAGIFALGACGGAGGQGVFSFSGDVAFTNSTYIQPNLDSSTAVSTLQFNTCTTGWTMPTSFAALVPPGGTQPISGLVLQADANQAFEVPEPGSLALLGAALGLLGFGLRRRIA